MQKLVKLLRGVYLFENFDEEKLKKISYITKGHPYTTGDMIFAEGEEATNMYVIKFGSVKLLKFTEGPDQEIGVLGAGMHFGELPFIDGEKRGLTVEVVEKSAIYEIAYDDLRKELNSDAEMAICFYCELAHFLSSRLRAITLDLTFAREKNLRHF